LEATVQNTGKQSRTSCFLTPQETEGPFYFDTTLVRQDITQDTKSGVVKAGLPLVMAFRVVDLNCVPMPNVLVDIWHCDKDGLYSGFPGQPGGINTSGQNFLRGIQVTDADGRCSFRSIYPGWYPGRVSHVHFKARLSSNTYVTSQFAFPEEFNKDVYATPLYAARGQNTLTNATDMIFRDPEPEGLVMAIAPNTTTGGYDGTFTIGVKVTTGLKDPAPDADSFALRQNFPNPFNPSTTIPYFLPRRSRVKLTVHDVAGREVASLVDELKASGVHEATFNAGAFSSGFYFYTLDAEGFVQTKEMLHLK